MRVILAIGIIALAWCTLPPIYAADTKLEKLRLLYYEATEDEDKVVPAIDMMRQLKRNNPAYEGVITVYIGSLTAVKARYAFWPPDKLEYANKGIDLMEKGREVDPDNIESLFIYGTTCYYLPFFFNKSEDASEALRRIVGLVDGRAVDKYGADMVYNALEFITENIELNDSQKQKAADWMQKLEGRMDE
jgi:hypothetical protein